MPLTGKAKAIFADGAMESWTDAMSKWSFDILERNPDARVDYYPGNMYRESVKPRYTEIDDAYEDFSAAQNSSMYKNKPECTSSGTSTTICGTASLAKDPRESPCPHNFVRTISG